VVCACLVVAALRSLKLKTEVCRDAPTFVDLPTCPVFMTDALFVT